MSAEPGTLELVCGKIASGKSTLAARLAAEPGAVLLSEDRLLARLYPGEIASLEDYARSAARLRAAIGPTVQDLLRAGVTVVMDFQTSTLAARAWMRELFEAAGAPHRLHYLAASDETCKARLRARNASGTHEYVVDEPTYELFTSYFVEPSAEEGFDIVRYEAA